MFVGLGRTIKTGGGKGNKCMSERYLQVSTMSGGLAARGRSMSVWPRALIFSGGEGPRAGGASLLHDMTWTSNFTSDSPAKPLHFHAGAELYCLGVQGVLQVGTLGTVCTCGLDNPALPAPYQQQPGVRLLCSLVRQILAPANACHRVAVVLEPSKGWAGLWPAAALELASGAASRLCVLQNS